VTVPVEGAAAVPAGVVPGRRGVVPERGWLGGWLVPVVPGLVTLGVVLWGITGSSYWRDEAATLSAVQRPFGQLLRMLGNVDAVHGAYYVVMWGLVRVAGSGELAMRLPSAVAMAVGAAVLAALGRRLVSPAAGLAAGLVFAVLPPFSLFGQNARPDAWSVVLAVVACYLLVRVAEPGGRRRWWLGWYAACMTVLGLVDIFGLLLLTAHAVTVGCWWWRERAAGRAGARGLAAGWLAAAGAAVVLCGPLVWLCSTERAQVRWIRPIGVNTLRELPTLLGPLPRESATAVPLGLGLLAVLVFGAAVAATAGRSRLAAALPARLAELSLPWLLIPGVLLIVGSVVVVPLFYVRYLLFCTPALALLAGSAMAALGRVAGPVALAVVTVLGVPAQLAIRAPDGHGENIRQADRILAAHMRPGEAAIIRNPSEESWSYAYPYGLARLHDLSQAKTPAQAGNLKGKSRSASEVAERLLRVSRVWLIDLRATRAHRLPILQVLGFRLVHRWRVRDIWMSLYQRKHAARS
jgi:mannosyltransferase